MTNPLNRPMFANGGSVYIPPALRYMAQNPDVFEASVANARARGLSGQNMQGQIERDAALHYAFHGQGEGRQYGGRTFLGGLLEPRLGDTFGLSPERKQELENERDAIANPPSDLPAPPAEGLVPLVPIVDEAGQGGDGFAKGGIVSLAEGGEVSEVYETSPVVQGYLQANPDVLNHAVRVAQSQGLAPGLGFQRAVENAARGHWFKYGKKEGRSIAGYADDGASLMTADSEKVVLRPQAENEGITSVSIDPRMLAFANILANTRDMTDPGTEGGLRAEFNTGANTVSDIEKYTRDISVPLYKRLIDAQYGDTNEDMVPGRVSDIINYAFRPNSSGDTMFSVSGGMEGLLGAYDQLGITGQGDTYADKQAKGIMELGTPITDNSSLSMDGTGGASAISQGGPDGYGYSGPLAMQNLMGDVPGMMQQMASVPTVNPVGLLNTFTRMVDGTITQNPFDMGEYGSANDIGLGPQFGDSFQNTDVSLED